MKPFGAGGSAIDHGSLSHHIGWIEALASDEEATIKSWRGKKAKRLEKVQEAIALLYEAAEEDDL